MRLVQHPTNLGYGQALRSGFSDARLDFVFYTDADNQFDMNELPLLLAWADRADVVAGFRRIRQDPFMRRANAWAWNRLVRALFYVPVRDIDCAFKLYRRQPLAAVDIESCGAMIDTEIMVKLARRGSAIVEVGVTHLPRTAGTARGAKPKVILRALGEVWRMYPQLSRLAPSQPPAGDRLGPHPCLLARSRPQAGPRPPRSCGVISVPTGTVRVDTDRSNTEQGNTMQSNTAQSGTAQANTAQSDTAQPNTAQSVTPQENTARCP